MARCDFDQLYFETYNKERSGLCYGCLAKEAAERDWERDADDAERAGYF